MNYVGLTFGKLVLPICWRKLTTLQMQQIQNKKLADVIAERIEAMLLDGRLMAGQRLPAERDLAEQFSVSRPSLREAIQKLASKGLLYRRQGGGTFVSDQLTPGVTDPLMELVASKPESQFDLLEFRHALEGMAAYYAALRGSNEDYQHLEAALQDVEKALKSDNLCKQSEALAEFYLCMAKGSHNVVLLHVMGNLSSILKENIQANLTMLKTVPAAYKKIQKQRKDIVSAIVTRNPEKARSASNEHLAFIEQTLLNINQQDSRMQRALRRIEMRTD